MNLIHKETCNRANFETVRKVALQHDNLCVWYQFDKAYWSLEIAK